MNTRFLLLAMGLTSALMMVGAAPASAAVTTFSYAGPPVPISDSPGFPTPGAPATADITVSGQSGAITDIDLRFDGSSCSASVGSTTVGLEHSFMADLSVSLTAPNGTQVFLTQFLAADNGGSGNNLCQTVFDDEATGSFGDTTSAQAPFTGSFTPASPLSAFDGGEPNGTWTLTVQDFQAADIGNIRAFSVIITTAQECGPPGEEVPATIVGAGTIVGTAGDDVIVGSAGLDTIDGGGGNDVICGEGGNDVIDGGNGLDVLIGDSTELPPFLPSNGTNNDHLIGGNGADVLAGVGGNDVLEGGNGDDELTGFGGIDTISGGNGADTAFGGPLNDNVAGGAGDDELWGNFGSDTITGGNGADFIDGDNPFPDLPPFDPGTDNDDNCSGGNGLDQIVHCETTVQ